MLDITSQLTFNELCHYIAAPRIILGSIWFHCIYY